MKHFSPLQIAALAVLTVIVVALAIVAFVTGKNHAADTVDISHPTTTPGGVQDRDCGRHEHALTRAYPHVNGNADSLSLGKSYFKRKTFKRQADRYLLYADNRRQ